MRIISFLVLLFGYTGSTSVILNRPLWSILSWQLHTTALVSGTCCFCGMLALLLTREKVYIKSETTDESA